MEKQVKTPKEIRQRRFLLVLPLLALPFMTMIFWALGGGKVEKVEAQASAKKGFNINLPDANLKEDKSMDKMSYYNQAQLDSVKFQEMIKNDPNYRDIGLTDTNEYLSNDEDTFQQPKGLNTSLQGSRGHNDPNTDKIYRKLAELDREMNKSLPTSSDNNEYDTYQPTSLKNRNSATVNSSDVEKLEQMMNTMNQSNGEDPELQQLNGMLDKILDVQNPERVQERLRQTSEANRGQVFAVSSKKKDNSITLLDTEHISGNTANGFYSLTGATAIEDSQNAIQAVIHETQTIVDGSTVKLRLVNDVFINGVRIPKDNFLFGIASLRGERLSIKINNVRFGNSLFPVELSVYDMDGLDGIYIPGAITRDVAKQSADRSMQTIGLTSLDPSWGAQAASAGIEAAKTLFSRKVKLIKVTVKAGYQILLRDENQKQSN
ncbi:MAG: conjugative transposon protein TraM [Niastella sp. SCN 39-18]|nr:conjugative transposon protein TraM [Sphingobacteriales bacterium]ODT52240.1 MAG: conjugative transposon protein TraM [Niastella sp. SCN 39-18]OJW10476.1 MAG: conjugative transposon protein TraM [Sphingobacteriales bacterium 39-19]